MNNLELLPTIGVFGQQITSPAFAQEDGSADTCRLSGSASSVELDACTEEAAVNIIDYFEANPSEESEQIWGILFSATDIDQIAEKLSEIKSALGEDVLCIDPLIEGLIDIFKCTSVECPVNCDEPPTGLQQRHIKAFEDTLLELSNCNVTEITLCDLSSAVPLSNTLALFPAAIIALIASFLSI